MDVHCWSVVALASSTPFSALYTMTSGLRVQGEISGSSLRVAQVAQMSFVSPCIRCSFSNLFFQSVCLNDLFVLGPKLPAKPHDRGPYTA